MRAYLRTQGHCDFCVKLSSTPQPVPNESAGRPIAIWAVINGSSACFGQSCSFWAVRRLKSLDQTQKAMRRKQRQSSLAGDSMQNEGRRAPKVHLVIEFEVCSENDTEIAVDRAVFANSSFYESCKSRKALKPFPNCPV